MKHTIFYIILKFTNKQRFHFAWLLDLRDLWVGVYWDVEELQMECGPMDLVHKMLHIYVCLIPCLPIHIGIPIV